MTTDPIAKTRKEFVQACKEFNLKFLTENKGRVYLEYIRDLDTATSERKGRPYGVLVAWKRDDGNYVLGWSVAKKEDKFDRHIGMWKAIRRATGISKRSPIMPKHLIDEIYPQAFLEYAVEQLTGDVMLLSE